MIAVLGVCAAVVVIALVVLAMAKHPRLPKPRFTKWKDKK